MGKPHTPQISHPSEKLKKSSLLLAKTHEPASWTRVNVSASARNLKHHGRTKGQLQDSISLKKKHRVLAENP